MARKIFTILLIFVCFYLGAHYWIRWRNRVTDDVTKISRLVNCEANDVRGIQIVRPKNKNGKEQTLAFDRADQPKEGVPAAAQMLFAEWKFLPPDHGEADAVVLNRLASMFCELYDPIPVRDEEFKPAAAAEKIVYRLANGESHAIQFGQVGSDRLELIRYQDPAGAEKTFKIDPKMLQLSTLDKGEYLNMRVMRMNADNVNVVSVYQGNREKFTLERTGDGWRVMVGGNEVGPGSEEARKFVNRLTTLKALKADEESLSPAQCERAQSRMSAEVQGVGDRKEAVFFQYKKTGPITVCDTARDALFTVHRDFIPYLETPLEKIKAK
jgi:hypothetical protein